MEEITDDGTSDGQSSMIDKTASFCSVMLENELIQSEQMQLRQLLEAEFKKFDFQKKKLSEKKIDFWQKFRFFGKI